MTTPPFGSTSSHGFHPRIGQGLFGGHGHLPGAEGHGTRLCVLGGIGI